MKKYYTLIGFLSCLVAIVLINGAYSFGRTGPYSGSPGDNGLNCSSCHGGSPSPITNAITSNIPASGYVAGNTYTLTLSISHPTNNTFGFQVTAEDASDNKVGTFVSTGGATQVVNGGNAVTHTTAGNQGTNNSRVWTVDWVAPAAGTGDVTFYVAFNSGNGNNGNNQVSLSNVTFPEDVPAPPLNLTVVVTPESCPGACDGTITPSATGGEGPPFNFTITGGSDINLCPGSYTVTVFDSQNNSTQANVTIEPGVSVTAPTVTQVWDRVEASSPDAVAYRWFVNGNLIPGADSSWVFINQNGMYVAEALSQTNCGAADSLLVENFSLSSYRVEDMNVYPNPGNAEIRFQTQSRIEYVEIVDVLGRIVHRAAPVGNQLLVPEGIASGRYILKIEIEGGISLSRLWERR
ncbi:MAG: T9SS C-terminal target domain-containing protein [Flavobacteriales bacterium]|nr:MAG: T9SS C-terminal target domain-containing protein [Flavobacteriales bacterium]